MKKSVWGICVIALLSAACDGSSPSAPSAPTAPTAPATARVEVAQATAKGTVLGARYQYDIDFNIIERGGVPILLQDMTMDFTGAPTPERAALTPDKAYGRARVPASSNTWSQTLINATGKHTSLKVTFSWNDDNGHTGTTMATIPITY